MRRELGAIFLLLIVPSCSAASRAGAGSSRTSAFACADFETIVVGGKRKGGAASEQTLFVVDPGAGRLSVEDGSTFTDACLGCSVTKQGPNVLAHGAGRAIDIDLNRGTGSESLHGKTEDIEHKLSGCHKVAVPANYTPLY